MKVFSVKIYKYPTSIVYANSKHQAIRQYALEQGFTNQHEMYEECDHQFGSHLKHSDCIQVECLSGPK